MDGYNVDGYGDINGNGDGYSNGDRTRDFFSQPNIFSPADGYENFNDAAYPFPGSSSVNAPRAGMAALDLNSHGQEWLEMAGYEDLLRSGPQGGGTSGGMGPPPVRVRSGSRTRGLCAARSGGGGGATAAHTLSSSSGGGRGPQLPPMTAGMRALSGSASGAPAESRSHGGRRQLMSTAVVEDNFDVNNPLDADDDEIFMNAAIPVIFQNPAQFGFSLIVTVFVIYVRILVMHCLG